MPQAPSQSSSPTYQSSIIDNSTADDEFVQRKINQMYEQSAFRKKTLEIVTEYTGTVEFMEKVQKYADKQIDDRLFKNTKVVLGIVVGWLVTAIIAFVAAKLGK